MTSFSEHYDKASGKIKIFAYKNGYFDEVKNDFSKNTIFTHIFEDKNLIVNSASILIASRMHSTETINNGLQYLAVGTGYGTGTLQIPQPETLNSTRLRVEGARKLFTSCNYITEEGNISDTPTKKLRITTTFTEAEANGALVEMGLFGGNATSSADTGYMFNYKVFPVINKDNTVRMTIVWELQF